MLGTCCGRRESEGIGSLGLRASERDGPSCSLLARKVGRAAAADQPEVERRDGTKFEIDTRGLFAYIRIAVNNRDPNKGSICKL
jgi:hypothetical protein